MIVYDDRVSCGKTVDTVGVDGLTVDGHGDLDIGRADEGLVLVGHTKAGLITCRSTLFGVGCVQIFLVDLLGGLSPSSLPRKKTISGQNFALLLRD